MDTLILPALNLGVLLAFLIYKLKSPLGQYVTSRHKEVIDGLDRTRKSVADAKLRRAEIEAKLARLDDEKKSIFNEWKEREAMQSAALKESSSRVLQQMMSDVANNKIAMVETMKIDLLKSTGALTVKMIEEKVKQKLNADTHQKINQALSKELVGA